MLDLGAFAAPSPSPAPAAAVPLPAGTVFDTDAARFEEEVIKASMLAPVIVDFWATWCGPCKQLMPMLEKQVAAAGGAIRMAKVDIDRNPELAQIFRVQSVPTVYAFFQGQPVDGFMGMVTESHLKTFFARLMKLAGVTAPKPAVDTAAIKATAQQHLAEGRIAESIAAFSDALDADAGDMEAMAGLGWCFVADGDRAAAAGLVDSLTDEQKQSAAVKGLAYVLSVAPPERDAATLQAAVDANPKDSGARFDLAQGELAALKIDNAIDALVELIRRDRDWQDGRARQYLIDLFDALGPRHPLTLRGRRKLSAVLFS